MAMIKCPECGHSVSDKAPSCPNCGVLLSDVLSLENPIRDGGSIEKNNRKKRIIIVSSLIVLFILCMIGGIFYFTSSDRENEAYTYAMNSNDITVLQNYLDTYPDASSSHILSITERLNSIKQAEIDWTNAVVSGSKMSLENYLNTYPNSVHRNEALSKIDSIDWIFATTQNTLEAYQLYLSEHPNGQYVDMANNGVNIEKTKKVSDDERDKVSTVFRRFFQSINNHDETAIVATVSDFMTTFLGKKDATKADVISFLNKIYAGDISFMEWTSNDDYKISKREIGTSLYEYSVDFTANQVIKSSDESNTTNKYRIKAKVDPNGKITEFNMVRIIE